jgi:hypothetical protein
MKKSIIILVITAFIAGGCSGQATQKQTETANICQRDTLLKLSETHGIIFRKYDKELKLWYEPRIVDFRSKDTVIIQNFTYENGSELDVRVSPNKNYAVLDNIIKGYMETPSGRELHENYMCVLIDIDNAILLDFWQSACGGEWDKNNNWVNDGEIIFDSDETENTMADKTEIPILENTTKITIDNSYFETKKGVKKIYYYDSEYSKYGITELSTLGMTSENHFVFDDTNISFSIITEVKLYNNIYSLIIRGDTEYSTGIWLVNYDKNYKESGLNFYAYIDSFPIGYDEWAEGASWMTSVVYFLQKPYIERESVSWENKENSKIEILESGKFKIIQ